MYTVTLIAQKGGTGKTTLAINLSVAAEAAGWWEEARIHAQDEFPGGCPARRR